MSTPTQHPPEKNESVEWNEYASKDATIQALTASPLPHDTPLLSFASSVEHAQVEVTML
jgi:hypothetical protein